MKKILVVFMLLAGLICSLQITSCKKAAVKVIPVISTASVTNITSTSATCGGTITSDGGAAVTSRGICWSTTQNPTTSSSNTSDGSGIGSFSSSITGLSPGVTYYVRAYATNSVGTAYGTQVTFSTTAILGVLTTTDASAITSTTATSGGNITSDGGAAITAKGVCWSTTQTPTISNSKTSDGTGTGIFTSSITGLTPGTTYYARAYATNSVGTSYGNQITFASLAVVPTLTTTAASAVTSTTATSGGNITSDGGSAVTAKGVCWSTSQSPTIANSKTTNGTGTGSFTSSITGLSPGMTYYVRAYATNSVGTAYGNQITVTALATVPTVTTAALTDITSTSVTSGGNVTNDGGAAVTAKGVCWSTSTAPTIANSKTTNGTGTGSFTSSVTGLTAGTTYYIRAYATNSVGTAYGEEYRANGLTNDINNLVPQSIIDEMKRLGMPVNTGTTPPTVNGIFQLKPSILKGTNIPNDYAIGSEFAYLRVQFAGQNNTALTVNVEFTEVNSSGTIISSSVGNGSFVVGNGQSFTVFVKILYTASNGTTCDEVIIFSGTLAVNSINNFHYSLFMLDNHGRNDLYITAGQGRVFWDNDGVSEKILSLRAQDIITKGNPTNTISLPGPKARR